MGALSAVYIDSDAHAETKLEGLVVVDGADAAAIVEVVGHAGLDIEAHGAGGTILGTGRQLYRQLGTAHLDIFVALLTGIAHRATALDQFLYLAASGEIDIDMAVATYILSQRHRQADEVELLGDVLAAHLYL